MRAIQRAYNSLLFYPVTTVYIAGVVVVVLVAGGQVDLSTGILMLTGITIVVALVGLMREMKIVHTLCNGHSDELRERISDLVEALQKAGIDLPPRETGDEDS